jgi:hypothetical protein
MFVFKIQIARQKVLVILEASEATVRSRRQAILLRTLGLPSTADADDDERKIKTKNRPRTKSGFY